MTQIIYSELETQIDELRIWFVYNSQYSKQKAIEFEKKYYQLVDLLKAENPMSKNYGISCASILDGVLREEPRVKKILRPDEIILTAEPHKSAEELYGMTCTYLGFSLLNMKR